MASTRDMMIAAAARLLKNGERVLVGVGIPNIAANLAKRLHAPDLVLIYESGVIDARPDRLPLSIGDGTLVDAALGVVPMGELFSHYLQTGWIDVGFLGAAQIDRSGNLNSTVIGNYEDPSVRLSGAGGASEIATHARRTIVVMEQRRDRFPSRIDFVTSPGHPQGRRRPDGRGPWRVVTNLGVYGFTESGDMGLLSLLPGHTYEEVLDNTSWRMPALTDPIPVIEALATDEERALGELFATLEGPRTRRKART